MILVVIGLVIIPSGELGIQEGTDPFGEGKVFLDT